MTNETPSARDIITNRPGRYTLANWSAAKNQAARLWELAEHARRLGLETQIESITAEAEELDREAGYIAEDLATRGVEVPRS